MKKKKEEEVAKDEGMTADQRLCWQPVVSTWHSPASLSSSSLVFSPPPLSLSLSLSLSLLQILLFKI